MWKKPIVFPFNIAYKYLHGNMYGVIFRSKKSSPP